MSRRKFLDIIRYYRGFILDRPTIDDGPGYGSDGADYAAEGSYNVLFVGEAEPVPFKGLALVDGVGIIGGTHVGPGVGGFAPPPPVVLPTWDSVAGNCAGTLDYETIDNEMVITKTDGTDGSFDRGLKSIEAITTVGAVEFQFIYTTPDASNNHKMFVGMTKDKIRCAYPSFSFTTDPDEGIVAYLQRAGDSTFSLQHWAYIPTSTYADAVTTETIQSSSMLYKFTLEGGVWKLYTNGALTRTFAYDSSGDPMYINVGMAWLGGELRITRWSNTEVF